MPAADIPKPQVLDPHRILETTSTTSSPTTKHPPRSCTAPWRKPAATPSNSGTPPEGQRHYLLNCLPPTRTPHPGPVATGAAPTGPDDQRGWQTWIARSPPSPPCCADPTATPAPAQSARKSKHDDDAAPSLPRWNPTQDRYGTADVLELRDVEQPPGRGTGPGARRSSQNGPQHVAPR
jgi:hypothetical protein